MVMRCFGVVAIVTLSCSLSLHTANALQMADNSQIDGSGRVKYNGKRDAPSQPKCDPKVKSVSKASWEKVLNTEVGFWDGVIASGGIGWERFQRTPITDNLRPYLELPDKATQSPDIKQLKILVVGSGPSSDIGYTDYLDANVNLVLTDPLAKMYETVHKKHNAYPPHQIMPLAGEELECFFMPNVFNLVYSVNALDHSYDPIEAMRQMVRVAVPCSWIVVELWENEGNNERGWGLHQWNFHMDGDHAKLGRFNTTIVYDVVDEMRKVGAEMSATRFTGCYLNGDCNAQVKKRLRMKIRKNGEGGRQCPASKVAF